MESMMQVVAVATLTTSPSNSYGIALIRIYSSTRVNIIQAGSPAFFICLKEVLGIYSTTILVITH